MSSEALDTTHNPGFKGTHRHGKHVRHTSGATIPHSHDHHGHIEAETPVSGEVEGEVVPENGWNFFFNKKRAICAFLLSINPPSLSSPVRFSHQSN